MEHLSKEYLQRFGGIARLYGEQSLIRFASARIAVIGLGGVGSWTVEALARSGIGSLLLMDLDDICLTNTNRQIHALKTSVGQSKAAALLKRVEAINPETKVTQIPNFYKPNTAEEFFNWKPDYILDAMDDVNAKAHLLAECRGRKIRVAVSGGAGGILNPCEVQIKDLTQARNDRLLAKLRKILRSDYGFPRETRRRFKIPTVFSEEFPVFPWDNGETCDTPEPGKPAAIGCDAGLGAATPLSGTFGFALASIALKEIAAK